MSRPARRRSPAPWILAAALTLWRASPAPAADLGASLSVLTDDRFRGHSLSAGRPAAILDLAWDDAGGAYLGVSATAVATAHDGVRLLAVQEYAGYAQRIGHGRAIDLGIVNANYSEYRGGQRSAAYREAYVGLVTDHVSAHLRYSPHYFIDGVSTIYADVDAAAKPAAHWRLNGHVGLLRAIGGRRLTGARRQLYDWRIGVARQIGPVGLQLALSGTGPGHDQYDGRREDGTALVLGASWTF